MWCGCCVRVLLCVCHGWLVVSVVVVGVVLRVGLRVWCGWLWFHVCVGVFVGWFVGVVFVAYLFMCSTHPSVRSSVSASLFIVADVLGRCCVDGCCVCVGG